jgi:hypothetical protein
VRFSLLYASAALASALILSACSGGSTSSSAIPGGASAMSHHGASLMRVSAVTRDTTNPCPSSKYYFCFTVTSSSSGPYVTWAACTTTSSCPPTYDLVATGNFVSAKKGKPVKSKKLNGTWSPNPGNPTYQYITGKATKKNSHGKVKYVDETSACYYYFPSVCSSTYYLGVILGG